MRITRFEASGFRNLDGFVFEPHPELTVLLGPNGAGKSSVLEAVQCLASGHTFRTRQARDYVDPDDPELIVAARLIDPRDESEVRCGLRRVSGGETEWRLNFEPAPSVARIAKRIPVKALTPDSHRLIQEGPEERRRFIDWGCFHANDDFAGTWRRYRRALSQRNEALRARASDAEVNSWNEALANDGERLDAWRRAYVTDLALHVKKRTQAIVFPFHMKLEWRSGWPEEHGLREALEARLETHRRLRTTADGPHRADLAVKADDRLARPRLSRGQQKLLVYLLHLAQLDCLHAASGKRAIVLCDDPAAELDADHLGRLLEQLRAIGSQVLLTAAEPLHPALQDSLSVGGGQVATLDRGRLQT